MQVKVTRPMVKALNETLEQHGMKAVLQEMPVHVYEIQVDYNAFIHDIDWNEKKNVMKVIRIDYPEECYAMPKFCTTRDLSRIFRECGGNTWDKFIKRFMEWYAI